MSNMMSTSPLSNRGGGGGKKGGGLFKWKKSSNNNNSSKNVAAAAAVSSSPRRRNNVSNNNPQHHVYNGVPQFLPTALHHPSTQNNIIYHHPHNNNSEYYYHCCNDELSRQLQLAKEVDIRNNEKRDVIRYQFRRDHYHGASGNGFNTATTNNNNTRRGQKTTLTHKIQGDILTQSTQATKDETTATASSSNSTLASNRSSLTNQFTGGGRVATPNSANPLSNAVDTAAQVFARVNNNGEQQQHQRQQVVDSGSGGAEKNDSFVIDWDVNTFNEDTTDGSDGIFDFNWDDSENHYNTTNNSRDNDTSQDAVMAAALTPQPKMGHDGHGLTPSPAVAAATAVATGGSKNENKNVWREAIDSKSGKTYYYNRWTKEVSWSKPINDDGGSNNNNNSSSSSNVPTRPSSKSYWREAVDHTSGKTYYYNKLTKEVSWTRPVENSDVGGGNLPTALKKNGMPTSSATAVGAGGTTSNNTGSNAMHTAKTPHRDNTSGIQRQQQHQQHQVKKQQQQSQQQQQKHQQLQRQNNRRYVKSPPRARASTPSLDSIAEDADAAVNNIGGKEEDGDDAMVPPPPPQLQQQQSSSRTRSKSPFRAIGLTRSRSQSPVPAPPPSRSRSPPVRHASSPFQSNRGRRYRGDDPDAPPHPPPHDGNTATDAPPADATTSSSSSNNERTRSGSPFRMKSTMLKSKTKKGRKKPVVNRMPSSFQPMGTTTGDVVSLVSYYDDPSIGVLSSLDDTTLASRSGLSSRKSSSVVAASSTLGSLEEDVGDDNDGAPPPPPPRPQSSLSSSRNSNSKKHADPPGNSIDEILKKGGSSRNQRREQERQYHAQLRDPSGSPYRVRQQQHLDVQQSSPHQSVYSGRQSSQQQNHRSVYNHHQQRQHDPPYIDKEQEQQQRSPYSQQYQQHSHSESQHDLYLQQQQQPVIYEDEDGNQWIVSEEAPYYDHPSQQPNNRRQNHSHRQQSHQQGTPQSYYMEEDDYEGDYAEIQVSQFQQEEEYPMPPAQLQTPRQGWQWSEEEQQVEEIHQNHQYSTQKDVYPPHEYIQDANGNIISFITPDPEEGDNDIWVGGVENEESLGMLTGDEEGLPLEEADEENGGGVADDDTAANTLNTVDLVAEVKRVWRHVQRYEEKKAAKVNNSRVIEKTASEEEMLVHQFSQAFSQATPTRSTTGRPSSAAGETSTKSSNVLGSDAAQISPEKEVVSGSNRRGRSRSKDSRLVEHIRSTSVHSRAHSSRGDSPAMDSNHAMADHAMMSHASTEMDGAFISEGIDSFYLSPGKPVKSTLKQQAHQKQHLLHPSQIAAAQKIMQSSKAATKSVAVAKVLHNGGQQHHDLASPYDFNKVKSTGTNISAKTQTISNTTSSNAAMKAHKVEMTRKHNQLHRSASPPRPPTSRNYEQNQQQREEGAMSPGLLYARALKNAKGRKYS